MLSKTDINPMLLNIALIIGGVVLICLAGTLPEDALKDRVEEVTSGGALFLTMIVQFLIFLPIGRIIFKAYNENKKALCLSVGAFGVGLVAFSSFVVLPLIDGAFSMAGDSFIDYINIISK